MNKYLKVFLHRGLIFGGFGPIVTGIVQFIISITVEDFVISGGELLLAIVSTYLLAFIHAGASVLNQIEEWSLARSMVSNFLVLYVSYLLCYVVNSWLPFKLIVIAAFTVLFAVIYFVIWLVVYIVECRIAKRINEKLAFADLEKNSRADIITKH